MSLDAIITDRSAASCGSAAARASSPADLALGVAHDALGLGPGLLPRLLPEPLASARVSGDDRFRLQTRACRMILSRLLLQPLELAPRLLRIVERLPDRLLTALEPCSSGRHANFASSASRTRNVTIVQMNSPGSGWTKGYSYRWPRYRVPWKWTREVRTLRPESPRLRAGRAAG